MIYVAVAEKSREQDAKGEKCTSGAERKNHTLVKHRHAGERPVSDILFLSRSRINVLRGLLNVVLGVSGMKQSVYKVFNSEFFCFGKIFEQCGKKIAKFFFFVVVHVPEWNVHYFIPINSLRNCL